MNSLLQRRLNKLEGKILPPPMPVADLSRLTTPELEVVRKLVEHALSVEQRKPTGKRPLPLLVERSVLTPDESLIYDGMTQRLTPGPGRVAMESRQ
jgi:hypothetical protein